MYACANYIYKLTWRTDAQIYGLINLHIFSKRIMLEVLNKWSYFNVFGLEEQKFGENCSLSEFNALHIHHYIMDLNWPIAVFAFTCFLDVFLLAHLPKGNVRFCHHLASVVR